MGRIRKTLWGFSQMWAGFNRTWTGFDLISASFDQTWAGCDLDYSGASFGPALVEFKPVSRTLGPILCVGQG